MLERTSRSFATLMYALVLGAAMHSAYSLADASDSAVRWVPTGNLNVARADHTATLLADGTVLIVGGGNVDGSNDVYLAGAETYDPATGIWSPAGSLRIGRSGGHTATLLPNGKVLVAGGVGVPAFAYTESAELYDPTTRTWSPTGQLNTRRSHHTATLLRNGKVLVAGGLGGFNNDNLHDSELYDPATGTWSVTGSMVYARYAHSATQLRDGKVLVAGGSLFVEIMFEVTVDSAELYDPVTGTWSPYQ